MKILHVIPGIDPCSGGPQYALRRFTEGQIARGHTVSILTTDSRSACPSTGTDDFLACIEREPTFQNANLVITPTWGRGILSKFGYAPQAVRRFRELVNDPVYRPDVIHLHEVFSYLLATSGVNARRYGIPYVITPHGSLDEVCYHSGHTMFKKAFSALWLKGNLLNSTFVHVTSEFEADQVSHLNKWIPKGSIRIVPLGADLPQYDSELAQSEFASAYPQLNGRRFVLHMARIHRIKRLEILVRAIAKLPEEYRDVLLVVAGQDSGHLSFVKRVVEECGLTDRVVFLGFVGGAVKQGAFEAAQAFALPSRHENHGVSVLEALVHGVPAIVTPHVASKEYVKEMDCGWIVEGTPEAFAAAMIEALRNPRPAGPNPAIKGITELLSWDRVLEDVDELYQEVTAVRKSTG